MRNRAILFTGGFLAAFSLAGCLIIPTDYYQGHSRQNVAEEPPAAVVSGTTTREEVLMNLGEPDEASRDETELWYIASKIKAIIIIGDKGGAVNSDYIHVIRFDRNGFVETLRLYNSATNSGAMRAEPAAP